MCNLYSVTTNREAIRQRARAMGEHNLLNFPMAEPDGKVEPIEVKARAVRVSNREARKTWFERTVEEALAPQGPVPDGSLKIVATGSKMDALI
jgi:hypothetical protein